MLWFAGMVLSARLSSSLPNDLFSALPSVVKEGGYVSSSACVECHKEEHQSWHRSYHRTMSKPAMPGAVKGDFGGQVIDSEGLKFRVFKKGEEYWAEMPDPDQMMYAVQGKKNIPLAKIPRVERQVLLTTGSHHYETYWVGSPRYDKLLQTLPLVYLLEDKRWAPRETVFMKGPGDKERFVTQWNHHCIRCHSTGGNPGLNEKTGMLETRVAEFGIACEACHGPGQKHIEHQRALAAAKVLAEPDPIVNPKKLEPRRSSEVCGQCHGVYIMRDEFAMESARNGPLFHPGEDLHRTRYYIQYPTTNSPPDRRKDIEANPEFFRERWWDDGMILAGGREYTAMSASACYQGGKLSCLACHSMHKSEPADQLKVFAKENEMCVQCHQAPRYTTELPAHTRHSAGSSGSQCLNCHMPHTTYALLKGIRSHQIGSPNLAASVRQGTPNACNLCHLDKTLAWTQAGLARWGKAPDVALDDDQQKVAASVLWLLKGNAAQRAITAWHYGWAPAQEASGAEWMAPFLAQLLNDPYGVVRYVAGRSARTLAPELSFDFLAEPERRREGALELLNRWKFNPAGKTNHHELLLTPEGAMQAATITRLRKERDNRPVTIKE